MTYMEYLKDNRLAYCPLKPVSDDKVFLENVTQEIVDMEQSRAMIANKFEYQS